MISFFNYKYEYLFYNVAESIEVTGLKLQATRAMLYKKCAFLLRRYVAPVTFPQARILSLEYNLHCNCFSYGTASS